MDVNTFLHKQNKLILDKYLKFFIVGLSIVLVILGFTVVPVAVGDSYEYVLMLEAFLNHFSPDIQISDVQSFRNIAQSYPELLYSTQLSDKLLLAIQNGEPHALSVLFKSHSGQYFAYHFWFYSLLNLPARFILAVLNLNGAKAFPLTNAGIMICVITYVLIFSTQQFSSRILIFIFYLLGCNFLYFHWSHPEFYTAATLLVASVAFLDERYRLAVLLSALAALQNPSSALFIPIIIFKAIATSYGFNLRRYLDKKVFFYLAQLSILGLISLIPYAFYYYHFGVFSLITSLGFIDKTLITIERFNSALFDLNQGTIVGFPGIILGVFFIIFIRILNCLSLKKFHFDWADCLVFVFFAILIPTLAQVNWNSGQEIFMRYGFWTSMPLLVWLAVKLPKIETVPKSLILSVVLLLQLIPHTLFLFKYQWNINHLTMKPYIGWIFKYLPGFYNPEPEIFAERVLGVEIIQGEGAVQPKYSPFVYRKEGEILNVLVAKSNLNSNTIRKICGGNGQLILKQTGQKVDFSKVKFNQQGWGYLYQPIYCDLTWPITIDFSSSGNVSLFISHGWSSPEPWGTWTDGTDAEIIIPATRSKKGDIILTATFYAFVNQQHPQQNIDVVINNKFLERWTFRYKDGISERKIKIPSELVNHRLPIKIVFKLKEAISPAQLNLSSDKRSLGMGLQKLKLEAIR